MISLPIALPAPLPIDELDSVLQSAGLTLVQTAADKHANTQAKLATEPAPQRAPRERPHLPPLEEAPLVQVETGRDAQPRANIAE